MKKIYALSSALLVAALGTTSVMADNFSFGDLQFSTIDDTTCELTKASATGDLVIPSKVTDEDTGNEYTVVSIGYGAFRSSQITSCVIPGTITKPGPNLFTSCSNLTTVTFEEGVIEMGYQTFQMCPNVTTVNLPESLEVLGGEGLYAGEGCAFNGCGKIKELVIPSGITAIPESTFYGCTSLESLTFKGEITSIGDNAFYNCNALASDLSFPAVKSLGRSVFNYCYALKSVELGESLENIPNDTFYNCTSLEDVIFGEGIKTIGEYAFNGCGALKTIAFPSTVTEIGANAFKDCKALTSVYCYSEVPPTAYDNSFPGDVYTNATLFVSDTAEEAYKAATCWSKFENVQGIKVGVKEITDNAVAVKAVAGGIAIEGTDAVAEIYTVSGQFAARTAAREIQLPAGLYIVRVAGISAKALVK